MHACFKNLLYSQIFPIVIYNTDDLKRKLDEFFLFLFLTHTISLSLAGNDLSDSV